MRTWIIDEERKYNSLPHHSVECTLNALIVQPHVCVVGRVPAEHVEKMDAAPLPHAVRDILSVLFL
jgi:hypothetical protein